MKRRQVLLCLFLLLPCSAMAQSVFEVSGLDSSMEYLGSVFGQMGTLPVGSQGSPLFAELIQIMNKIIFFLGIIIILYAGSVSTIQTAQEGEVLGKKWSTIWVPVRAGLGLFLLLPSPGSGYSFIQMTIMYFIVQGVGAANAIWERVLYHIAQGTSIVQEDSAASRDAEIKGVGKFLDNIIKSELCAYRMNTKEEYANALDGESILAFQYGHRIIWGTEVDGKEVCGSLDIPVSKLQGAATGPNGRESVDPLIRQYVNLVQSVAFEATLMAEEAWMDFETEEDGYAPENWVSPANLLSMARVVKTGLYDIHYYYTSVFSQADSWMQIARAQGWIHAGSFYSKLITADAQVAQPPNYAEITSFTPLKKGVLNDYMSTDEANTLIKDVDKLAKDITTQATAMLGAKPQRTFMVNTSRLPGGGLSHAQPISDGLKLLAMEIIGSMSGGKGYRDPLVALAKTGQTIMYTIEVTFWVLVVVIPLVTIASIPPCLNPLWGSITTLVFFVAALFMTLAPMLWSAGVLLGLYVPLIPWLVYTFSAIAWIILVIEAIVAAPLVALILIVPSEDELGKAGHSLVILLGLVFRPPLMVLGFILGAKVLFVAVGMLDFGFKDYIISNISGIGLFGVVAVIVLYCGVVITIIHQCFSLIYVIPDKVLRWMGGQSETQDVMGKVQQIKGYGEKGAGATSGLMKGGMAASKKIAGGK